MATEARRFIGAIQVTLDGCILGGGEANWIDSWADGLGLIGEVDAFVLGGGMFPDYGEFWGTFKDDPATVAEWLGREVYPREIEYARIVAETPNLVLTTTATEIPLPSARIVRDLDALRTFKAEPGGDVYVVGGGLYKSLLDADLLDELRLLVHPVAIGSGPRLLDGIVARQDLELLGSDVTDTGRVQLRYRAAS